MAIDIDGTFKQLQGDVNQFVGASDTWRKQITSDCNKDPSLCPDQAEKDALDHLEEVEHNLTKDVGKPPGGDPIALRDRFIDIDGHLTAAKDLYSLLFGVSRTPEAINKETVARNNLKHLIKEMDKLRPQIVGFATENLFLVIMGGLVGVDPILIGGVQFQPVTKDDFELTQRLFRRERFALDDEAIQSLIKSWETVIASFVENNDPLSNPALANQVNVKGVALAKVDAEANLFTMHSLLEVLYEQLETNVKRTTIDILSSSF